MAKFKVGDKVVCTDRYYHNVRGVVAAVYPHEGLETAYSVRLYEEGLVEYRCLESMLRHFTAEDTQPQTDDNGWFHVIEELVRAVFYLRKEDVVDVICSQSKCGNRKPSWCAAVLVDNRMISKKTGDFTTREGAQRALKDNLVAKLDEKISSLRDQLASSAQSKELGVLEALKARL